MKNKTEVEELENFLKNKLFNVATIDESVSQPYNIVFNYYSNSTDIESLKRAIFMQWYVAAENGQFNDFVDLDIKLQLQNLNKLKTIVKNKTIDIEFLTMLNHYIEVCDWYFNISKKVKVTLRAVSSDKIDFNNISKTKNRGILGIYYGSFGNV